MSSGPTNLPDQQNEGDIARRGLVSLNNLQYTMGPDLSVSVNRAYKFHFSQQREYAPSQRIIVISNSGAEYVDPKNSYLKFTVRNTSGQWTNFPDGPTQQERATAMGLGSGSALNFIKRIIITSRSGDEIERIERVNQMNFVDNYTKDASWFSTVGAMMGYSPQRAEYGTHSYWGAREPPYVTTYVDDDDTTRNSINRQSVHGNHPGFIIQTADSVDEQSTHDVTFCIPLSCICGLFKTDQLLPSMLTSGLRFEFELEDSNTVAQAVEGKYSLGPTQTEEDVVRGMTYKEFNLDGTSFLDGTNTYAGLKWKVIDPTIVFDQHQLTDSIQRVLNEESAVRGLEIPIVTQHNTQSSLTGNNLQLNQEIRKAVSRALTLMTKTRDQVTGLQTESFKDSFLSAPFARTSWQVRIGSLYFPQQPVNGTQAEYGLPHDVPNEWGTLLKEPSSLRESYLHTMRAFGKLKQSSNPARVTIPDFLGYQIQRHFTLAVTNHKRGGYDILACDLERSAVQELTGIPINNSRVAEVRITYASEGDGQNNVSPDNRTVDTWLSHVRLLRIFLQNIEIEE